MYHANTHQKKARESIPDTVDVSKKKKKDIICHKEGHFIIIKESSLSTGYKNHKCVCT